MAGQPNILFILIDALRVDRLSCYGYKRLTSPNIDRIAQEGLVFQQAIANSTWTVPSVASIFSGLYLSEHQVNAPDGSQVLSCEIPYLPELLHHAGYQTAGFSNNPYVSHLVGFHRGFTTFMEDTCLAPVYRRSWSDRAINFLLGHSPLGNYFPVRGVRDRATRTVEKITDWLGAWERGQGPFFVFAHFMELHAPLNPPIGIVRKYARIPLSKAHSVAQLATAKAAINNVYSVDLTDEQRAVLNALYDAAISQVDSQVGVLYKWLDEQHLLDQALLVVVADHGENLGEHGLVGHSVALYDTLVRVPLILRHPDIGKGRRVDTQAELVRLFPTLLDAAGLRPVPSPKFPWRASLLSQGVETKNVEDYSFSEHRDDGGLIASVSHLGMPTTIIGRIRGQYAVRTRRRKYIVSSSGEEEFYDLNADPYETKNLAGTDSTLSEYRSALRRWRESLTIFPISRGKPQGHSQSEMEDLKKRLRHLGYM